MKEEIIKIIRNISDKRILCILYEFVNRLK